MFTRVAVGMGVWAVGAAIHGGCAPLVPGPTYIHTEKALGPYSGSVLASEFCFISGKTGEAGGSFEHEVETALLAVEHELERAGLTLHELVQVTVYLTDLSQLNAFNQVYAAKLPEPWPARTTVGVAALPMDARVEIQALARRH